MEDMGPNKLEIICDYKDWKAWKASFNARDTMLDFALMWLNALHPINDASGWWVVLAKHICGIKECTNKRC
jgi:hypothetical protein